MEVCGEAEDPQTALKAVMKLKPDLAIVDISLGEKSGIDMIRDMKSMHPDGVVIVLSMHDETFYAERAMRAGASGYLMKGGALDKIVSAVRRVLQGGIHFSDKVSVKVLQRLVGGRLKESSSPVDSLSEREMSVFELIGEGLGPNEIAQRLCLSVKTIETYRAKIKLKLDISDASALRRYAIQWIQNCRGV
jgi:DNA-binding NarL/FixJ family response regulator